MTPNFLPDDVDREVDRLHGLRFSPEIEARFERDGRSGRIRLNQITLFIALVLYDGYLINDWNVLPDVFGWLATARLGVVTPIVLATIWLLPRCRRDWQIDALIVVATVVGVLLPSIVTMYTNSPYFILYQFGDILTIIYMTLVHRVRFRMAALGLAIALLIRVGSLALRTDVDGRAFELVVNFYLVASVLALMGSFALERTIRYGFLQRLRAELLIERIEETARTDQLTGLYNRHHLVRLGDELARTADDDVLGALLIDIDHFKRFNDTQGHLAGDVCIRTVSDLLRETLATPADHPTSRGIAVRFGGEEFLVLLPGMTTSQAASLGDAMRRRVEALSIPYPGLGAQAVVTISIGVAAFKTAGLALDRLVNAADQALYRAKREGRNRVAVA